MPQENYFLCVSDGGGNTYWMLIVNKIYPWVLEGPTPPPSNLGIHGQMEQAEETSSDQNKSYQARSPSSMACLLLCY
jgi:hypothetical protein